MYRDPTQWETIRHRVLQLGQSQRKVSAATGIDPRTIGKMLWHKFPPPQKTRKFARPKLDPHLKTIDNLLLASTLDRTVTVKMMHDQLRERDGYSGSYSTLKDYVAAVRRRQGLIPQPRGSQAWSHLLDALAHLAKKDGIDLLRALSKTERPRISERRVERFFRAARIHAALSSRTPVKPAKDELRDWTFDVVQNRVSRDEVACEVRKCDDLDRLLGFAQNGNRFVRNKALTVLLTLRGAPARAICEVVGIARRSCVRYQNDYASGGLETLLRSKSSAVRKYDKEAVKQVVFALLHEPPANYGINRTTWKMKDFTRILHERGEYSCPDVIRTITKAAGYRWRKARVVLTSKDPDYRVKLQHVQSILASLTRDEGFFSIDEFGPFAVKMKGGLSLVPSGEQRIVPQWQKSKGCIILTAALELSTNQITHFYSTKKNTNEMIRMMDTLVRQYKQKRKSYLSWDAASWHISKRLREHITDHNSRTATDGGPTVETAPLPSGAQFLNVIESVFSGMARAIIHNSDYQSVLDAKSAIDKYFEDRNAHFIQHPKRAGKKIWGSEREPPEFSIANNCKDPRYM